jgi:hypothetical protein
MYWRTDGGMCRSGGRYFNFGFRMFNFEFLVLINEIKKSF